MSGTGNGQGVTGFIANSNSSFDPATDAYPPSNPTVGFTPKNEGFAGIIHGTPTGGGATLELYCIDIETLTYNGIGYALGTWDAANVPNVGFVSRILSEFFPNTDEPVGLTLLNRKAAAVQAAIWFFSDRYVLSTSDPLHDAVVAIVNQVKAEGPPPEQPLPPSLTVTPSLQDGPAGSPVGPFTVTTNAGTATLTATGGTMFSDSAGTVPIAGGAAVPSGQKVWLRSAGGSSTAVLQARSQATVPTGNVYLYAGNNPGVNEAQKLILAKSATLTTTVQATAQFLAPGSLVVTKTIAGPAAGSQSDVVIHVDCNDGVARTDFVIPAGADAGDRSRTYGNIPARTACTVTETADGSNVSTSVVVAGNGQAVTIPTGGSATAHLTDTYDFVPGSLLVRKTIAGPAAGQQGEVRIRTVCDGTPLTPDFVIPAGTPAGDRTKQYDQIDAPATCTVTETVDGHTSAVSVVVDGSGQKVSVPAGRVVEADITDAYGLRSGQLEVTKTIEGPAAGQQGAVVIHTVCNGTALTPDFVIAPGAPAGVQSQTYSNVPPGRCVITETADGRTSTVAVTVTGSPNSTTIPAGGAGTAHITDTYDLVPGSLLVRKTISGPAAGQQGEITIHTECDGTALPDFVIPAGTPAGDQIRQYDRIPAPATCTVAETADGQNSAVSVVVDGSGQTVSVPAGGLVTAEIADSYGLRPGQLEVTKTIAGPLAGQQGAVVIHTVCNGTALTPDFVILAGAPAGVRSHIYSGVPAPASCEVTETTDGHTDTVAVSVTGSPNTATIPAGGAGTAHITDTYGATPRIAVLGARAAAPGSLLITKITAGPLAGRQGRVTIRVACNGTVLSQSFVIAAKTRQGRVSRSFDGIPAGSGCTVTETANGATATVVPTVVGSGRTVTVPGGRVVAVTLMNVYQAAPGSLRVTKTIAGPVARLHGRIAILAACGGRNVFAFRIPARTSTPAGSVSRTFAGLGARSLCRVNEVVAGATHSVALVAASRRRTVTIRANGIVTAHLVDRFASARVPRFTG